MEESHRLLSSIPKLFFIFFLCFLHLKSIQAQPTTPGYSCSQNTTTTTYPCKTYVFYRAQPPDRLELANISDFFAISRPIIAKASNITSPSAPLISDQSLIIPIDCSCNSVNSSFGSISYAPLNHTIISGDTFYKLSTIQYENLTTYQSVEAVNPTLVATNLSIGDTAIIPVFCKCPTSDQLKNGFKYLISYVFQPSDNLNSIARKLGTTSNSIIRVNNGNSNFSNYDTVFVPVSQLPQFSQPVSPVNATPVNATVPSVRDDRKGLVTGLGVGIGILGLLVILLTGLWIRGGILLKKKRKDEGRDLDKKKFDSGERALLKDVGRVNLISSDVADCLDKYTVFGIQELRDATDDFDEKLVIHGSVYRGTINGELYAIKKLKWNAYEELKILQKVNHGNLVRLEGFCIDEEEGNCYLVYEYLENGSLYSWLHADKKEKLNWRTRLRIAIDVANGLQYIHEHTRPRVVHKDIKSSNILLDSTMRAKIGNFGLAKSGCNAITMHIVGTQGYIAPEYLSDGVVSTKMDVFAFGVVLLELVSGKEAIDNEGRVLWAKVDNGRLFEGDEDRKTEKVREWMDEYLVRETLSMEGVVNVMSVAIACVQRDPSKRPSMVDIVYALCKSDDGFFDVSGEGFSPKPQIFAR